MHPSPPRRPEAGEPPPDDADRTTEELPAVAAEARGSRTAAVGVVLAALLAVLGLLWAPPSAGSPRSAGAPRAAGALPAVGTNFAAAGPFQVTVQNAGEHTYYSPSTLGEGGITHPVILWGNGTGTPTAVYEPFLRHLASHGFVVAAANTTAAGDGRAMLAGLDNLTRFNGESGNRFQNHLDLDHVGTTGHSQGGGGAMNAAHDPRVDTTFPLAPGLGTAGGITGSALYFAGQNDIIISPAYVRFSYTSSSGVPAAYAELAGANHLTAIGDVGGFRGPATAWARWQLAGDTNGAPLFTGAEPGLASAPEWSAYEANARLTAGSGPAPTTPPSPAPADPDAPAPTTTTPPTTSPPSGGWWSWLWQWFRDR